MRKDIGWFAGVPLIAVLAVGCAGSGAGSGSSADHLTAEDIALADVSTLYEAVQRLRPRWLEVRAPRGMQTDAAVVVFMDRTYLGGVDELRGLGTEVAASLEFMRGSRAQGELRVPIGVGVAAAIIVHSRERDR